MDLTATLFIKSGMINSHICFATTILDFHGKAPADLMELMHNPLNPLISRPDEHERLVADLIDRRFFGPVAITTSLPGARGMGKTFLAKAICADARVVETFPDGIYWVTLGRNLTPLELLSRIERLAVDISGEKRGLIELKEAEEHLHELVHPRRLLLVLDEATDFEAVRPFLHTGPGGAILMITHLDGELPFGTRLTRVDIMVPGEAVALLAGGLVDLSGANLLAEAPPAEQEPGEETISTRPEESRRTTDRHAICGPATHRGSGGSAHCLRPGCRRPA